MRSICTLASLCLSVSYAVAQPGDLSYGALPVGSETKPVLLFLHGWHSSGNVWRAPKNDMESMATEAGYRTAFLDLHPDKTMWSNAPLICNAVDQIKAQFPSAPVVLISHSKGGVDAHTAITYYGLGSKVDRLITLAGPHWGTPIADLAWSPAAGLITTLLGRKNEGNRVMQTGYMAEFRNQTDVRPESRDVPIYTATGTKAGPFFSPLYFGGLIIGSPSDGTVSVESSQLSYQAGRLFTEAWNHSEMCAGHNAWPYILKNLSNSGTFNYQTSYKEAEPGAKLTLDRLYRDGEIREGVAIAEFPMDAGQPRVTLLLQTTQLLLNAVAEAPSGLRYPLTLRQSEVDLEEDSFTQDVFPGSILAYAQIDHPEAGKWRLRMDGKGGDAYFLTALFPDDQTPPMDLLEAKRLLDGDHPRSSSDDDSLPAHLRKASTQVRSERVVPPVTFAGFPEPTVLNHTMVMTWPGGRERTVVFSEAE